MSDIPSAIADRLDRAADRMSNAGFLDEERKYRSAAARIRSGVSAEEAKSIEHQMLDYPQPGMLHRLSAAAAQGEYDGPQSVPDSSSNLQNTGLFTSAPNACTSPSDEASFSFQPNASSPTTSQAATVAFTGQSNIDSFTGEPAADPFTGQSNAAGLTDSFSSAVSPTQPSATSDQPWLSPLQPGAPPQGPDPIGGMQGAPSDIAGVSPGSVPLYPDPIGGMQSTPPPSPDTQPTGASPPADLYIGLQGTDPIGGMAGQPPSDMPSTATDTLPTYPDPIGGMQRTPAYPDAPDTPGPAETYQSVAALGLDPIAGIQSAPADISESNPPSMLIEDPIGGMQPASQPEIAEGEGVDPWLMAEGVVTAADIANVLPEGYLPELAATALEYAEPFGPIVEFGALENDVLEANDPANRLNWAFGLTYSEDSPVVDTEGATWEPLVIPSPR